MRRVDEEGNEQMKGRLGKLIRFQIAADLVSDVFDPPLLFLIVTQGLGTSFIYW